jgi:DNA-binding transcriptional MerR regulator
MKSKERHDLKTSEMDKFLEELKKFSAEQGTKVLAIAVLVIVVAGVFFYVKHTNQVARQQDLEQLIAIQSGRTTGTKVDDVRAIAQQTSDKKIAAAAWKLYGDMLYDQYMTDKNAQPDLLNQAQQAYQTVVNEHSKETVIAAGAQMGLAAIYENQGKWADAKQIYQNIVENKSLLGTGLPKMAQNKLSSLAALEKSAQQPLATTQPTNNSAKPATSSTPGVAK